VRVTAPGVVLVDPYPLSASRIEVEINARHIEDVRHGSAAAAAAAYHDAEPFPIRATLVSAVGGGR
jgi:hypothetical protein